MGIRGLVRRHLYIKTPSWAPFQYKDVILPVKGPHYKDRAVSRQSYLYNGNPHTCKDHLYTFKYFKCKAPHIVTRPIKTVIRLFKKQTLITDKVFMDKSKRSFLQGFYSLSGKTSYRQISWSLEATRIVFRLLQSSKIWQAHRQQRYRDTCQISERFGNFMQSRVFETSR